MICIIANFRFRLIRIGYDFLLRYHQSSILLKTFLAKGICRIKPISMNVKLCHGGSGTVASDAIPHVF